MARASRLPGRGLFRQCDAANLGGLDHPGRVFLGLALLHRYKNSRAGSRLEPLFRLLSDDQIARCRGAGQGDALRRDVLGQVARPVSRRDEPGRLTRPDPDPSARHGRKGRLSAPSSAWGRAPEAICAGMTQEASPLLHLGSNTPAGGRRMKRAERARNARRSAAKPLRFPCGRAGQPYDFRTPSMRFPYARPRLPAEAHSAPSPATV
jgi:hypothetical protein